MGAGDIGAARPLLESACDVLLRGSRYETEAQWLLERLLTVCDEPERRRRVIVEMNELLAAQQPHLAPLGTSALTA